MWNPRPGGFHGKRDRCLCSMAYVDENDLVDDVSGVPGFVRSVEGMREKSNPKRHRFVPVCSKAPL